MLAFKENALRMLICHAMLLATLSLWQHVAGSLYYLPLNKEDAAWERVMWWLVHV